MHAVFTDLTVQRRCRRSPLTLPSGIIKTQSMAMIHVNRSGTSLGTFSEEDVRAGLRAGRFAPTDLGWREGMAQWQPLSQFAEFATDIPAAGAPPPAAAAPA